TLSTTGGIDDRRPHRHASTRAPAGPGHSGGHRESPRCGTRVAHGLIRLEPAHPACGTRTPGTPRTPTIAPATRRVRRWGCSSCDAATTPLETAGRVGGVRVHS